MRRRSCSHGVGTCPRSGDARIRRLGDARGGSIGKIRLRIPARRPRQIRGDIGAMTPRPPANRSMGAIGRVAVRRVRAIALGAAAMAVLGLGASSPRAAPPALHSLANSSDSSSVLTIKRPIHVAPADVLIAAIAARTSIGAIYRPPGWTLIRRDMSGNVGAGLSVALYFRIVGEAEPTSYRWAFDAPVMAVGSIQAYGGVSRSRPVDRDGGLYTPDSARFAAPS